MFTHRFREQLSRLHPAAPVASAAEAVCAFVPCPVFHTFTAVHQTQLQEIYRVAAERTREQLRPRRSRTPQFSRN